MSSFTRRGTAALVLIASLTLGTAVQASAAPPRTKPAPTAAEAGASWLATQFTGQEIETGGAPDPSSTVQAVLAFAASGVGAKKAKDAMTWLKKNLDSYVSVGGVDDAGSLAYVILAAQAMGDDPTAFGGKKPANNLIARLEATQRTSGADAGLFGASDPTYDGAFRQGLALAALANQGVSRSGAVMTAAVSWLLAQQCSDGGWESYRSVETACPAPDPTSFAGPDTNSTSLAVMGLVAAGATFTYDPTAFFESAQNTDGGFEYVGAPSAGTSDPDSTGEVIQALVALDQISNPAFDRDGNTPQSALATFQLTCASGASEDGAYTYPGEPGPNLLATLQAIPGAAEKPLPYTASTGTSGVPRLKCPAA